MSTIIVCPLHEIVDVIEVRKLEIDLADDVIAHRIAEYERPAPPPGFERGVMAKYAATVSSAANGAVTS